MIKKSTWLPNNTADQTVILNLYMVLCNLAVAFQNDEAPPSPPPRRRRRLQLGSSRTRRRAVAAMRGKCDPVERVTPC